MSEIELPVRMDVEAIRAITTEQVMDAEGGWLDIGHDCPLCKSRLCATFVRRDTEIIIECSDCTLKCSIADFAETLNAHDALVAENAKLRAALEQIRFYTKDHEEPGEHCVQCLVDDIARTALAEDGKEKTK